MDVMQCIKPELLVIVPVLWLLGKMVKDGTGLDNKHIPLILGAAGVLLAAVWVLATLLLPCGQTRFWRLLRRLCRAYCAPGLLSMVISCSSSIQRVMIMSNIKLTETITSPHNSNRGNHKPQLIVCHIADGTYEGTKAWFKQNASQTSSHYIVAQDGRVCQCVPLNRMAWCNGTGTGNKSPSLSAVELVRQLGGNANQYSVSIECEGYYSKTGGTLTDAQLDALVDLIRGIQAEVQRIYGHTIPFDRQHIVGHCEITPLTRPHCPGEKFPWDKLMARLNGQEELPSEDAPLYRVQVGAFRNKARNRQIIHVYPI